MPKLEYFLVAESCSTDQRRNSVSIFHVLDEISLSPPIAIPAMVAISSWNADEGEKGNQHIVTIRIHRPGVDDPDDFVTETVIATPRFRVIVGIEGLPIENTGELRFEVLLDGKHKADHTVTIKQIEENAASGNVVKKKIEAKTQPQESDEVPADPAADG